MRITLGETPSYPGTSIGWFGGVAEAVVDADALPSVSVAVAEAFVSVLVIVPFLLLAVDCPVVTFLRPRDVFTVFEW